ncbi:TetR/AcrR family transcriptional regulator [Brumimicrobium glaciale]|jgi:AcrR family transcriptional regulator|uniref:TetR/AcrR family transcriptional regulator n=1 Tax=Brumimicrobium glaciale TaxID=200475 RepID=A0A4Q4KQ52_9FLAO|nr:TetR/AcrR family transcriptional regulator [Brumimicrobium glaciale]RYM35640.1 TetR/AcrR family transcriptional regulator [Brumimicrobium glaciale]
MDITERQQEIITAAGKILTASGIHGLTIKNLAKEMKFSESAVYRHFASKEEIIIGMLTYLADNMDGRFKSSLSTDGSIEDRFRALFESQFNFFNQNPHFAVAVFSDGLLEGSKNVNQAINKIMQVKMKYLMPVVLQGQKEGVFTNAITTEDLMHVIMGSLRLLMYKWRTANFEFDILHYGKNMIETNLILIKSK